MTQYLFYKTLPHLKPRTGGEAGAEVRAGGPSPAPTVLSCFPLQPASCGVLGKKEGFRCLLATTSPGSSTLLHLWASQCHPEGSQHCPIGTDQEGTRHDGTRGTDPALHGNLSAPPPHAGGSWSSSLALVLVS
uniref:Uncharacterized protein n=1 Tax=Anser cygnoides TaxID=8845 RepID=A0A8B9IK72_ANSCY